jgi:Pyruvate/2-oxoacid:ferredoxin oxidoreductase delta subunit
MQTSFSAGGILNDIDCIISLPKLKTHQLMLFTGAMKNLFGLLPSLTKSPYHVRYSRQEDFAAMIVDLNLAAKPAYAFMDAIIGMEGHGPGSGNPRTIGLILASSNVLAIDAAACEIIGYPLHEVPINKDALDRKYWLNDFSEIDYCGIDINALKIDNFEKIPLIKTNKILGMLLPRFKHKKLLAKSPRPMIQHDVCIRCGDCMRICGSKAMSFVQGKDKKEVHIDYKKCIRCYCCHEICPAKAIEIEE